MSNMQRRDFVRHVGAAGLLGLGAVPLAFAAAPIKPDAKSVLLVIDVQNCFAPGGSLPVKDGQQVVPVINKLSQAFELFPGDLIYSGTPENVGPVVAGDVMQGSIAGLPTLNVRVV